MRHRLELVVDEQLRQHEEEAEGVHAVYHALKAPRVPAVETAGRVRAVPAVTAGVGSGWL